MLSAHPAAAPSKSAQKKPRKEVTAELQFCSGEINARLRSHPVFATPQIPDSTRASRVRSEECRNIRRKPVLSKSHSVLAEKRRSESCRRILQPVQPALPAKSTSRAITGLIVNFFDVW
ncbi:hypothetical protein GC176_27485 [bacterium]|nr:hypothetical protein [bacterium]